MKYWIVDSFTDKPFGGNPAAVCLVENFPDNSVCLKIASEINFSEIAFVKHLDYNRYWIRWFAPHTEVKLCGHGTLASAHVLWNELKISSAEIIFESLSGPLIVKKEYKGDKASNNITYGDSTTFEIILDFPKQSPEILKTIPEVLENIFDEKIVSVAKFADDFIIELNEEDEIWKFCPDFQILKQIPCRALAITAKSNDNRTYDFISRFFVPKARIQEDPVTGSIHCKLAPYWASKLGKNKFRAYQASERCGFFNISLKDERVHLSGSAVTMMRGEFCIPI